MDMICSVLFKLYFELMTVLLSHRGNFFFFFYEVKESEHMNASKIKNSFVGALSPRKLRHFGK